MSRVKIASHSFLIQNFHEFFNLLLRQKEFALRAPQGNDPQQLAKQTEDLDIPLVNTIQRRLSILLEEQAIESTLQVGEFASSSYQDALYAMVAFADEVFLNISWVGQKQWENNLWKVVSSKHKLQGNFFFKKSQISS